MAGTAPMAPRWPAPASRRVAAPTSPGTPTRRSSVRRPRRRGGLPAPAHPPPRQARRRRPGAPLADTTPTRAHTTMVTVAGPSDARLSAPAGACLPDDPCTTRCCWCAARPPRPLLRARRPRPRQGPRGAGEPDVGERSHLGGHRLPLTALVLPTGLRPSGRHGGPRPQGRRARRGRDRAAPRPSGVAHGRAGCRSRGRAVTATVRRRSDGHRHHGTARRRLAGGRARAGQRPIPPRAGRRQCPWRSSRRSPSPRSQHAERVPRPRREMQVEPGLGVGQVELPDLPDAL